MTGVPLATAAWAAALSCGTGHDRIRVPTGVRLPGQPLVHPSLVPEEVLEGAYRVAGRMPGGDVGPHLPRVIAPEREVFGSGVGSRPLVVRRGGESDVVATARARAVVIAR